MKDKLLEIMLGGFGLMIALFAIMVTLQIFTMTQVSDIDRRVARMEGANSVREYYMPREMAKEVK